MRRMLVAVGLGTAMLAAVGVAVPGRPASASHPCGQNPDGSTYDPAPTADHAACPGARPAAGPGDVQLTEADNGRTVSVAQYRRVFVELHAPAGQVWSDIDAGRELHRSYVDVQSAVSEAVFSAASTSDGTLVSAGTDAGCLHTDPACAQPVQSFSVTVVVTAASPSSASPTPSCMPASRPAESAGVTVLDESADGMSVAVPPGDAVLVAFAGQCGDFDLQPATGAGPLFRYRARGADRGSASAVFRAVRLGSTTLQASSDPACFHATPTCAIPSKVWRVTVTVAEPCAMGGVGTAAAGALVSLKGRVRPEATVRVWFRRRDAAAFSVRRTLTADRGGVFTTSYAANDDYRWYATSGDCATPAGLTRVLPGISGPQTVARAQTVPLLVTGPAGAAVQVWMHGPGQPYALRRTGQLDATGRYRTSYLGATDQRYYAVTGPDRRTTAARLTQVR